MRLFCSTYGGTVTGVRVNEDSFIVVTATVPGDDVVDVTIAVGPDGTCACKVAAPDVRAFEQVLATRLAEAEGTRPCRRQPGLTTAFTYPRCHDSPGGAPDGRHQVGVIGGGASGVVVNGVTMRPLPEENVAKLFPRAPQLNHSA